jgi:hypothetical protein
VLAAANEHPITREQRLWNEEVARLLGAATTLEPAKRGAVLAVLQSLVDDPTESPETRRDVPALLDALNTGTTPSAVLHTEDARVEPRHEGHRALGLAALRRLRGPLPAR